MTKDFPVIAHQRVANHLLNEFKTPDEVVSYFGAVQAQDYYAALWALRIRMGKASVSQVEAAFNEGKIIRTHIMRPTWHFVSPKDIRWMLKLTSPRVQAFNDHYYRKSGLDKSIFQKSNSVILKALQGGKQLTRTELNEYLKSAQIPTDNLGLSFTIMQAELEGIICSGPRKGKQFTYLLLDERVPKTRELSEDEALAELLKRYFQSHGPAQIQDFVWWSGLTVADAKKGINILKLKSEEIEGKTYYYLKSSPKVENLGKAYLLPPFDEYFIAYKDRTAILDKNLNKYINAGGGRINGAVMLEGVIIGTWKRKLEKKRVVITVKPFAKLIENQVHSISQASGNYGKFLGLPAVVNAN
jgi:hypothetical protein